MRVPHRSIAFAAVAVVPLASGCRGTGHLAEYDFAGRTVAARSSIPPHPEVLTGPWFIHWSDDPIRNIIRAGTEVVREVEASRIRARLDSAAATIDVADRLTTRAHERAAFHLRADRTDDERRADYLIEVFVEDYGIDAESWEAAAHFYVDARLTLIDGGTGRQIWDTHVTARDRIAPAVFGPGAIRNVVTARALAAQSVPEIARTLERLADFAADRITERLRSALEKVRADDGVR